MSISTQVTVVATAEQIIVTAPGALRGPTGDVTPEVVALVDRAELASDQAATSSGAAASSAGVASASAEAATSSSAAAEQQAQIARSAAQEVVEATQYNLSTWAYGNTFRLVAAVRNADGAILSADIIWPDSVGGSFVSDSLSVDFPGAIDAWHATYVGSTTKTVTQPLVTRDANGAVIAQPAITIV